MEKILSYVPSQLWGQMSTDQRQEFVSIKGQSQRRNGSPDIIVRKEDTKKHLGMKGFLGDAQRAFALLCYQLDLNDAWWVVVKEAQSKFH
jgi:hypothetical protein